MFCYSLLCTIIKVALLMSSVHSILQVFLHISANAQFLLLVNFLNVIGDTLIHHILDVSCRKLEALGCLKVLLTHNMYCPCSNNISAVGPVKFNSDLQNVMAGT